MGKQRKQEPHCEALEGRLLLAAQTVVSDLERDWSDLQNPNGAWSLYVYDDSFGDQGRIIGGWMSTQLHIRADLVLSIARRRIPLWNLSGSACTASLKYEWWISGMALHPPR